MSAPAETPKDNAALLGMLCYLPIQGIWFFASLGMLVFSKLPLVRFHAKQSLLFGGLQLLTMAGPVVAAIALTELTGNESFAQVLVNLASVAFLATLALRVVGSVKAWKREWWVCPGLGWLTRRWVPAEQP